MTSIGKVTTITSTIITIMAIGLVTNKLLTLQRQVGLKKGNDWRVLRAAWHFVTVGVEQVTASKIRVRFCLVCLTIGMNID